MARTEIIDLHLYAALLEEAYGRFQVFFLILERDGFQELEGNGIAVGRKGLQHPKQFRVLETLR